MSRYSSRYSLTRPGRGKGSEHRRCPGRAGLLAAVLLLAASGSFLLAPAARAQGSVRAWGMACAYTAAARGIDAVDWNPANLALTDGRTLGIASAAVDLSNNAFSLDRYNEISGATLTQTDKDRILADIPPGGLVLNADVRASALGFRSGPYALTVQGLAGGSGRLDRDFFELILLGNEVNQSISFADTEGEAYAVAGATFSAARPLWTGYRSRLSAGINVRYLYGIYELHVEEASGTLVTTMSEITGRAEAALVSASGGSGYGVDIGLALQAPRGWVLGLALDNLYSRMSWSGDPERHLWSASADSINLANEDLDEAITNSDTTVSIDPYASSLPRRLRLGASNQFGDILLAVDVTQGLESRAGVSTRTALSAGLEWRAWSWMYPRFGLGLGGASGSSAAVGLGLRLGPWRLDLALLNRGSLWPDDTKGLGLAAGSSLEF